MPTPIYIETTIDGPLDWLWDLTQSPERHATWDLRFSEIRYHAPPADGGAQAFDYETRLGFGLRIRGGGETAGQHSDANGAAVSALRFWSHDRKSLIESGAGYWRYVPIAGRVRFLTRYDYRVRFGALGRAIDALAFRPLMRWATAWSFDRLRLWIEQGIDPALSRDRSLVHAIARLGVAFVWAYQGLAPKLLGDPASEIELAASGGVPTDLAPLAIGLLGVAETLLAFVVLCTWRRAWPFAATIVLLAAAVANVAWTSPSTLLLAFNPVSLNVAAALLALIAWITVGDRPSAGNCRFQPSGDAR